ncbi:12330_t:CDS:2, partial [Acaulospora colombiana]
QEHAMAIQSLNDLILQRNEILNRKVDSIMDLDLTHEEAQEWASLYALLGTWAFVARSSNPQDIRTLYFDPAVVLLDPLDQIRRRGAKTVYYQYADFADKQLRQLEGSDEYKRKKDWVARLQGELDDLKENYKTARSQAEKEDIRRQKERTQKLLDIDEKGLNDSESSLKSFLQQAIAMYAHYMEVSHDQDQEIAIRFCGLWFSKFESEVAAESIRNALQKISTYKLLFLSHQLTARLGTGSTKDGGRRNQRYIHQLVEAMCIQHPYHSLLQVLTAKGSERPLSNNEQPSSEDLYPERSEEAQKIVDNVRSASHQQSGSNYDRPKFFLNTMEEAFEAFIEWARFPIKQLGYKSGMMISIPRSIALYHWTWDETTKRDRPEPLPIPVVTADLPVEMDGQYNRIPTLHYYLRQYNVA